MRTLSRMCMTVLATVGATLVSISTFGGNEHYVGGDISMLDKYVEAGAIYIDKDGAETEPLALFKAAGWNMMRLRLFVNPENAPADDRKSGAVQDLDYVIKLGKKIKDAGFKLMLDFHYSDTWTDPGKHSTPAIWESLTVAERANRVGEYTRDCLLKMIDGGATPDYIQPGNEITVGMLWPTGKVYASGGAPAGGSWDNLAAYLASATDACREVCPEAKIVIHTEMHAPSQVAPFYAELAKYQSVSYDVIGLSYYPDYHGTLATLSTTLTSLEQQQADKDIMIVETGYGFRYAISGAKDEYKDQYPLTAEGQRQFTADLVETLNQHEKVTGILWWFPEDNLNNIVFHNGTATDWSKQITSGYWNASLFDQETGRALAALYELKGFLAEEQLSAIADLRSCEAKSYYVYDLAGREQTHGKMPAGIFVTSDGRKIIQGGSK